MTNFTYSQLVSMISYYLWKYPSVAVALECVHEDVEGDATIAPQVFDALTKIKNGEVDTDVLRDWGKSCGAESLCELAERIAEGRRRNEDIGYFVRKYVPITMMSQEDAYVENTSSKKIKRRRY